jgi:hypothetical protein
MMEDVVSTRAPRAYLGHAQEKQQVMEMEGQALVFPKEIVCRRKMQLK